MTSSGKYARALTFQNFLQGTLTDIRTFGIPNVVVPTEDTLPKSGYSSVVRKAGKILVQIFQMGHISVYMSPQFINIPLLSPAAHTHTHQREAEAVRKKR